MKICLVRCPSPFLIDEKSFPPLGLMAVGAGLKRDGFDVVLYDGDIAQLPMDYEAYGFGPTSPEYPHAVDCLHRIKQANPTARVVVGGPHVTISPEACLDDGFDCIVVGDGENAAAQAFTGNHKTIYAPDLPLDEYPMPDRTLVDLYAYKLFLNNRPSTTVMSSRGCPFKCAFCCKNNPQIRLNSADRMITELAMLQDQFGYDAIAFPEDIFIINKLRTYAVCRFLKRRGIIWRCLIRADLIIKYGHDFIDMMVDSGCVGVGLGVESGSNTILKNIHKAENAAQMRIAIRMLKSHGLFVKAFFIVGLPGENEQTLAETDQFLREAKLDDIDIKIYQPYPGSPIFDHKERYDIDWDAVPLEYMYYKGRPGEYYGNIRTSALTTEQIVDAWKYFEDTYKDWSYAIDRVMVGRDEEEESAA